MLEFPDPANIDQNREITILERNRSAFKSRGESKTGLSIHGSETFKLPEISSPRYQSSTNSDLSHLTSPRKFEKS
jgi:hypothetical protein